MFFLNHCIRSLGMQGKNKRKESQATNKKLHTIIRNELTIQALRALEQNRQGQLSDSQVPLSKDEVPAGLH